MSILFVTGIDTGVGKTYAVGLIARSLMRGGKSTITLKVVQTGCSGFPEDIDTHRKIMGIGRTQDDMSGLTCPYLFKLPASPHLAARAEGAAVDPERIADAIGLLTARYDHLVVEGAGGLCVPLNDKTTILEFVADRDYPVALVSSPRLGSINHTLMSIELMRKHSIDLKGIVYNLSEKALPAIEADSRALFKKELVRHGYSPTIIDIPEVRIENWPEIDFGFFGE